MVVWSVCPDCEMKDFRSVQAAWREELVEGWGRGTVSSRFLCAGVTYTNYSFDNRI